MTRRPWATIVVPGYPVLLSGGYSSRQYLGNPLCNIMESMRLTPNPLMTPGFPPGGCPGCLCKVAAGHSRKQGREGKKTWNTQFARQIAEGCRNFFHSRGRRPTLACGHIPSQLCKGRQTTPVREVRRHQDIWLQPIFPRNCIASFHSWIGGSGIAARQFFITFAATSAHQTLKIVFAKQKQPG